MRRTLEDCFHRPCFHHAAAVQNRHPVAGFGDDPEIVGDQDDAHRQLATQAKQQFQNLVLYRDVERSRRLIGQKQFRTGSKRNAEHRALPHATREFVRIARQTPPCVGNADQVQQLDSARARERGRANRGAPQGFR